VLISPNATNTLLSITPTGATQKLDINAPKPANTKIQATINCTLNFVSFKFISFVFITSTPL